MATSPPAPAAGPGDAGAVAATSARVEQLLAELGTGTDPAVADRAEQLVRALVELYGAGLARMVELTGEDPELLARLAADPLLAALLVLHDLHPLDARERVSRALEQVRPFLGQHAGDVELLAVDDSVVRLRLSGNCHGCPASEVTVRQAIETAVTSAAPEIEEVKVEGVVPQEAAAPPAPLLQIERTPPHPYAGAACPAGSGAGR